MKPAKSGESQCKKESCDEKKNQDDRGPRVKTIPR